MLDAEIFGSSDDADCFGLPLEAEIIKPSGLAFFRQWIDAEYFRLSNFDFFFRKIGRSRNTRAVEICFFFLKIAWCRLFQTIGRCRKFWVIDFALFIRPVDEDIFAFFSQPIDVNIIRHSDYGFIGHSVAADLLSTDGDF